MRVDKILKQTLASQLSSSFHLGLTLSQCFAETFALIKLRAYGSKVCQINKLCVSTEQNNSIVRHDNVTAWGGKNLFPGPGQF
jgi:hypothetical protein